MVRIHPVVKRPAAMSKQASSALLDVLVSTIMFEDDDRTAPPDTRATAPEPSE